MAKSFMKRTQVYDEIKVRGQKEITKIPVENLFQGEWKGHVAYFATFKHNKKLYKQKNLTSLFGITEIEDAKKKIAEIKKQLLAGIDPFEAEQKKREQENTIDVDSINNFADLVEISVRNVIGIKPGLKNSYTSYNAHFKPLIKNMDIGDFKYPEAKRLFEKVKDKLKADGKRYDNIHDSIRKTIRAALNEAVALGKLTDNPLDLKAFRELFPAATVEKSKLETRIESKSKDTFVKFAREIHSKILNFKQEVKPTYTGELKYSDSLIQAAMLFSNMCGRRVAEFNERLKYEDISTQYFVRTITKTKKEEEYPLPEEIIERLLPLFILDENGDFKLDEKGDKIRRTGLVFNIPKRTLKRKIEAFMEDIETEFRHGEKMTWHDNRNLLVSIPVDEGWTDRKTANQLISHAIKDSDNSYFAALSAQAFVMNNYWELLRGNLKSIHEKD